MTSTDTQGISDEQLIEHLHARGWSLDKIDVAMIREGAAALAATPPAAKEEAGCAACVTCGQPWPEADALAAIKAARAQALEEAKPALAEAAYDAAINYAQGREVDWNSVIEDAIRLLGEDAGRGES